MHRRLKVFWWCLGALLIVLFGTVVLYLYGPDIVKHLLSTFSPTLTAFGTALLIAGLGWWRIRATARVRAAFDIIVDKDAANTANVRIALLLAASGADLRAIARARSALPISARSPREWHDAVQIANLPVKRQQYIAIVTSLDWYEAVALAVRKNIADEDTVYRFLDIRIKAIAEDLWPFIDEFRNGPDGDPSIWIELTTLAESWGWKQPASTHSPKSSGRRDDGSITEA